MSLEPLETNLPADVDAQLDQLLAVWRTHRQLDSAKAEAIRQAILESPTALPDEWWQRYVNHLNEVVRQANRSSQRAMGRSLGVINQRWPWFRPTSGSVLNRRDWQPYLKLV